MARARREARTVPQPIRIDSDSGDGRGVARLEGKAIFVNEALAGELVRVELVRRRNRYDEGEVVEILEPSPDRVTPGCAAFGICGGCALQHQNHDQQLASKQTKLLDCLHRIGRVVPERVIPPLKGKVWGYRSKARLGAKLVLKKGGMLIGFRERHAPYIADIEACPVLDERVSTLIRPLRDALTGLSSPDRVPQIEVACTDSVVALVLRHMDPLTESDEAVLRQFGKTHGVEWYVQPAGLASTEPLRGTEVTPLSYELPAFDLRLAFEPQDFTQINPGVNQAMVSQAVELLAPDPNDAVTDLFCGIGNFSLALARSGARVLGVEGELALVHRAQANARRNQLSHNASFVCFDLYDPDQAAKAVDQAAGKILIDPPRTGAHAVCEAITEQSADAILYVSCNPATLARDAEILVHRSGYQLSDVGLVDMFPHTAHAEAMAFFTR